MLPSNIVEEDLETFVRRILEKKGGWSRVEEVAQAYAKGDGTRRTRFYRWRRKEEKKKGSEFQFVPLPRNMSYIGLKSADPGVLRSRLPKEILRSIKRGFGVFDYLEARAARKDRQRKEQVLQLRRSVKGELRRRYKAMKYPNDEFQTLEDALDYLDEEYPT